MDSIVFSPVDQKKFGQLTEMYSNCRNSETWIAIRLGSNNDEECKRFLDSVERFMASCTKMNWNRVKALNDAARNTAAWTILKGVSEANYKCDLFLGNLDIFLRTTVPVADGQGNVGVSTSNV